MVTTKKVPESIRDTLLARAPGNGSGGRILKYGRETVAVMAGAVGNNMLLPAPWIKISKRLSTYP